MVNQRWLEKQTLPGSFQEGNIPGVLCIFCKVVIFCSWWASTSRRSVGRTAPPLPPVFDSGMEFIMFQGHAFIQ